MSEQGGLSRRNFLRMVGAAGGSAAVHETLVALGLMRHPTAWADPPEYEIERGDGKTVAILGAGVGGLAAAYKLQRYGYRCTIIEAQDRVGGRSHTARRGDKVREEGREDQECRFDDDERLYVNLGPGRIPYHHRRVLDLCKELDVLLEVYVHTSDFNLHQMSHGAMNRAIERRRIANDTQGYIAELLAKAVNQDALDRDLGGEDKDKLLRLLQKFGELNGDYRYKGSTRAGCEQLPVDVKTFCDGVEDALEPLGLDVLLDSEFWDPCLVGAPNSGCPEPASCDPTNYGFGFYQVKEHLWQTTSFQPVGGMDKIVKALEDKVTGPIKLGAIVEEVGYADGSGQEKIAVDYRQNGTKRTESFDFCISNIPIPVLKVLRTPDFDQEVREAVRRLEFSNSCKVGWQANRRFWELDHHIYGGISWTDHDITQIWYPSNDYFSRKGVMTGAYNYSDTACRFGRLSYAERLKKAYEGGALLHPKAFDGSSNTVPEELGISIAWQNVPFQKGCSANWKRDDERHYERLLVPDMNQRFYFVGDQVSSLPGWQEGALMSAEHVVRQIATGRDLDLERIREEVEHAPFSLEIMG